MFPATSSLPRFNNVTLNHYHPFSIILSPFPRFRQLSIVERAPCIFPSNVQRERSGCSSPPPQFSKTLLRIINRALRYFAPDATRGNRNFRLESAIRNIMERAKERRGKGTRDELLRPPSPFKKRCEKVYFVGRCVIRVITLTSLLPEEKREREGEGKSKKNTVRAAGAPKGLRRGARWSSHCQRLMLAFFAS